MVVFPEYAKVGRIIAKENFFDGSTPEVKNLLKNEIARITWEYKLAPNTINLPSKNWPEMEVIKVDIKNGEAPYKVLKRIDTVIPYPILFIIKKGTAEKAIISYKEIDQKSEDNTKVERYFETQWNDPVINDIKISGLDIDSVFYNMVRTIAGQNLDIDSSSEESSIRADIDKTNTNDKIRKQIKQLEVKYSKEVSVAKRQKIAKEIHELQLKL